MCISMHLSMTILRARHAQMRLQLSMLHPTPVRSSSSQSLQDLTTYGPITHLHFTTQGRAGHGHACGFWPQATHAYEVRTTEPASPWLQLSMWYVTTCVPMLSHRSRVIDNQICYNAKVRPKSSSSPTIPCHVLTLSGSSQCAPAVPYSVWGWKCVCVSIILEYVSRILGLDQCVCLVWMIGTNCSGKCTPTKRPNQLSES